MTKLFTDPTQQLPPPPEIIGQFEAFSNEGDSLFDQEFECTKYILGLPLFDIQNISDSSPTAEAIGKIFVDHDESGEVQLIDSIIAFFEVEALGLINQEMLDKARADYAARPMKKFFAEIVRTTHTRKTVGLEGRSVSEVYMDAKGLASNLDFGSGTESHYSVEIQEVHS